MRYPIAIEQLRNQRNFRGWTWAVVEVEVSEFGDKAARINITLPQRILRAVDAEARRNTLRISRACGNRRDAKAGIGSQGLTWLIDRRLPDVAYLGR